MTNQKLSETLELLAQAGFKVSEIENDLLFKAIVKVLVERRELKREGSKFRGAMTKIWRKPVKTVQFGKTASISKASAIVTSRQTPNRRQGDVSVPFSKPG
uniref:Uncharacterized protein n=1 Tax=Lotharella oceanica TaxID=641309 RepID=A0A7S2TSH8_9EUKA|mmetsp:Transcript_25414/g.47443  ORF Transcript_25414/g.47443 Transcript_25414/m.47443 type:complete len:101 (+) Transcript_25414:77-379(+)